MGGQSIGADAEYDRMGLLDLRDLIAKTAGFFRSSRRVVFGIEVEHYLFAPQAFQSDYLTGGARQ